MFSNLVFDFFGLLLVAIFVRNQYTEDHCEGVRNLPPQTMQKIPGTAPVYGPGTLTLR